MVSSVPSPFTSMEPPSRIIGGEKRRRPSSFATCLRHIVVEIAGRIFAAPGIVAPVDDGHLASRCGRRSGRDRGTTVRRREKDGDGCAYRRGASAFFSAARMSISCSGEKTLMWTCSPSASSLARPAQMRGNGFERIGKADALGPRPRQPGRVVARPFGGHAEAEGAGSGDWGMVMEFRGERGDFDGITRICGINGIVFGRKGRVKFWMGLIGLKGLGKGREFLTGNLSSMNSHRNSKCFFMSGIVSSCYNQDDGFLKSLSRRSNPPAAWSGRRRRRCGGRAGRASGCA